MIQDWEVGLNAQQIRFSQSGLNAHQVHGVPPDFFTKENVRQVGARAGEVMAMLIPKPESKSWGRFFRVQVLVNIEQLLVVGYFRRDYL